MVCGHLLVYWQGSRVVVLKGVRADKLIVGLPGMDVEEGQLALARATGSFKRGNERLST